MDRRVRSSHIALFLLLLTLVLAVPVLLSRASIALPEVVRRTPSPTAAPAVGADQASDAWLTTIVQDDAVLPDGSHRAQMRGRYAGGSGNSIRLTTRDGVREAALPDQLQYKCLPREVRDASTGVAVPAFQTYMNLVPYVDSMGRMTRLADVLRNLAAGDEVVVVGTINRQYVLRGRLVVVIKC